MSTTETAAPFFYALTGAAILFFCLQVWRLAMRYRRGHRRPTSKMLQVRLIDQIQLNNRSARDWALDTLTEREMQVAQMSVGGKRNSEIARDLSISLRTVETHLQHVYDKLGVRSRADLARVLQDIVD